MPLYGEIPENETKNNATCRPWGRPTPLVPFPSGHRHLLLLYDLPAEKQVELVAFTARVLGQIEVHRGVPAGEKKQVYHI